MKRVALITGASSGLGRAFALRIGAHKALDEIWLVARRGERLEETARLIPLPTQVMAMDVTDPNALEALEQRLLREGVFLECLVNSAGMGKVGDISATDLRDAAAMVELNCRALTELTIRAIPFMGEGSWIVELGSIAGFQPLPGFAIYAASKAYVQSFSKALHQELKRDGIHVTCVNPYWVEDTEFIAISEEGGRDYRRKPFSSRTAAVVERALKDARRNKAVSTPGIVPTVDRVLVRILPDMATLRVADFIRRL